jgi:hypothetical protein
MQQRKKKKRWQSRLWPRPKGSQPRGSLVTITNKKKGRGPQRSRSRPQLGRSPIVVAKKEKAWNAWA